MQKESINKINYVSETSIYASDNTEKNLSLIANSLKILNLTNKINLSVKDIVEFAQLLMKELLSQTLLMDIE